MGTQEQDGARQRPRAQQYQGRSSGDLHLDLPAGLAILARNRARSPPTKMAMSKPSASPSRPQNLAAASYPVTPVAEYQGHSTPQGYETVGYAGLRPYNYYQPGPYKLVGVDVKVAPGLKVGYVMGTGDDVPQSLESMGVAVHLLQAADINSGNLSAYDVIVLGIRAYAARPELAASNGRLLDYVKQGGVLIVQYNTREYDHNYGPYPITSQR